MIHTIFSQIDYYQYPFRWLRTAKLLHVYYSELSMYLIYIIVKSMCEIDLNWTPSKFRVCLRMIGIGNFFLVNSCQHLMILMIMYMYSY